MQLSHCTERTNVPSGQRPLPRLRPELGAIPFPKGTFRRAILAELRVLTKEDARTGARALRGLGDQVMLGWEEPR